MKKIFLLFVAIITTFCLTGCLNKNSIKDYLFDYSRDELHDYMFNYEYDWINDEYYYSNTLNNDTVTGLLLLSGYLDFDIDMILGKVDSSVEEVKETYENMVITDVSTAFNMILVYTLLDLDLTKLETWGRNLTLSYINSTEGYYGTVYPQTYLTVINSLNMLGVNTTLKNSLISKFDSFDTIKADYIDADLAAMIIISLQGSAHQDYLDYLYTTITSKGVANYSGEMSCSSTSMALMALMSEGVVYANNAVVDYVLSFRVEDGFKQYLTDDSRDVSYASPQAFCALATAYLFEETSNKVLFY